MSMLREMEPNGFIHWKIFSSQKDARLCEVKFRGVSLGVFWKYNSPDAQNVFEAAVVPRDRNGNFIMTEEWKEWRLPLLDYGRPLPANQGGCFMPDGFYSKARLESLYSFRYDFTESEAHTYAQLITQAVRNTPDEDESITVQKHTPQKVDKAFAIAPTAFWIILAILALLYFSSHR